MKGAALGTVGLGTASVGVLASCAPQSLAESGSQTQEGGQVLDTQAVEYPVSVLGSMEEADEVFEGDVVVLGCGPAGIACSTRLAEEGARVLLVEKTDIVGGTGLEASGNCYISLNSKFQLDQGLEADIPAFYKEWLEAVHYHCDHEVLSTYLRNCGRAVDWLYYDYGFEFYLKDNLPTNGLSGNEYRISQPPKADGLRQEVYGKMVDLVVENGGEFHTGCTGTELIVDQDGSVVGLRAERGSDTVDFMGKAVVICTGGYGANADMIKEYCDVPLLGRDPILNNGEGALMSWAAGAQKPWNLGILCCDSLYPVDTEYVSYNGGVRSLGSRKDVMHVNQLGKRFHSEDAFCWMPTYGGANAIAYEEPFLFAIVDQPIMDALAEKDDTVNEKYLDSMNGVGVVYWGDTPEELAEAMGVDAETFAEELKSYNEMCNAGEDPMFFKTAENLVALSQPPYYAIRFAPTPFGTCGDLTVTPKMEVRGVDPGSVVKGLYAAGIETVGVMHNDYYWALGQTVGWAHTSGMLAAENIVSDLL